MQLSIAIQDSTGAQVYSALQSMFITSSNVVMVPWVFPAPSEKGTYTLTLNVNGLTTVGNQAQATFTVGKQTTNTFYAVIFVLALAAIVGSFMAYGEKKKR